MSYLLSAAWMLESGRLIIEQRNYNKIDETLNPSYTATNSHNI